MKRLNLTQHLIKTPASILYISGLLLALLLIQTVSISADGQNNSTESAASLDKEAYMNMVKELGSQAIETLTSRDISEEERKIRFEKIFNENFAVSAIAQFVLGPYRRRATPQEKAEFLSLFKKTIADIYAARFKNYTNETFKVKHARPLGTKGMRVHSEILRAGAEPVLVEWKIYPDPNGNLKIFDVIVERLSMSTTQQAEFSSIIKQNGGTVSGLNAVLREKLHGSPAKS